MSETAAAAAAAADLSTALSNFFLWMVVSAASVLSNYFVDGRIRRDCVLRASPHSPDDHRAQLR